MLRYDMSGGEITNTYSTINNNTSLWTNSGQSFYVPTITNSSLVPQDFNIPLIYLGSASISYLVIDGPYQADSMCFKSNGPSGATSVSSNYWLSNFTTNATIYLPSNPKDGEYVNIQNWAFLGRNNITIDGNGKNIRGGFSNTLSSTIQLNSSFNFFHYDGTNWNNIID